MIFKVCCLTGTNDAMLFVFVGFEPAGYVTIRFGLVDRQWYRTPVICNTFKAVALPHPRRRRGRE